MPLEPLDRVIAAARRVLDADVAMLSVVVDDTVYHVGRDGTRAQQFPLDWALGRFMPPGQTATVFTDVDRDERFAGQPLLQPYPFVRWIVKAYLPTDMQFGRMWVTILGSTDTPPDNARLRELRQLQEIALDLIELIFDSPEIACGLSEFPEVRQAVEALRMTDRPFSIVDSSGRYLEVSHEVAETIGINRDAIIGRTVDEVASYAAPFVHDLIEAVTRKRDAVRNVEFRQPSSQGGPDQSYLVTGMPVRGPNGTITAVAMIVTHLGQVGRELAKLPLDDADRDAADARERPVEQGLPGMSEPVDEIDPTSGFLIDTLIRRNAIRSRDGTHYTTLRTWRKPVKDAQVVALKHLKRHLPRAFVAAVADEMVQGLNSIMGENVIRSVVAVPCGHSGRPDCLSVRMAREIAARIGAEAVEPFEFAPRKGSSHPKRSSALPPLKLMRKVAGPALIVDDVATSGQHISQVVKALEPSTSGLVKMAWIGGDGP